MSRWGSCRSGARRRPLLSLVLASCAGGPATSEAPPGPVDPDHSEAAIQADLETLCRRIEERSVATWGQATMMTDRVQDLTLAIDRGDTDARCALGRLMRAQAATACAESIPGLIANCDP